LPNTSCAPQTPPPGPRGAGRDGEWVLKGSAVWTVPIRFGRRGLALAIKGWEVAVCVFAGVNAGLYGLASASFCLLHLFPLGMVIHRDLGVLCFLLWIICWSDVFYSFWEKNHNSSTIAPVLLISPTLLGLTMVRVHLGFLCLLLEEQSFVASLNFHFCPEVLLRRGCHYVPETVCIWRYTTFYIYYAFLLVALVLSCLTDQLPLFSQAVKDSVRLP
ncbi:hypothetical protein GOODEAATRI_026851, partial [Goodea atripinnis]